MLKIRLANANDTQEINHIINDYILHTPIIFDLTPWEISKRDIWLQQFDQQKYFIFVAEINTGIIGVTYNTPFMEKPAYDISSEVSIYLSRKKEYQSQGIGSQLYKTLFNELSKSQLHRLYTRIALPNAPSIKLHQKYGFQEVAKLNQCGYKFGQFLDVAILEKKLK